MQNNYYQMNKEPMCKIVIYGDVKSDENQIVSIKEALVNSLFHELPIKINAVSMKDMKKERNIHIGDYMRFINECDFVIIVPKSDADIDFDESTLHMMEFAHFLNQKIIIFKKDVKDCDELIRLIKHCLNE